MAPGRGSEISPRSASQALALTRRSRLGERGGVDLAQLRAVAVAPGMKEGDRLHPEP